MQPFLLLLAWHSQLVSSRATRAIPLTAEVSISTGTVVTGLVDSTFSSVRQFLGIPYAEPPLGELRFEPPRANKLPVAVNATTIGKSCTQFTNKLSPNEDPEYSIADGGHTGEDCLTLSVWAPQDATNLPVLVYFYGGGWLTGGQSTPYQNPTPWVQRTKDLIIVVPNTRVNIFGFPNARGVQDQNPGYLDQRLAVEWVRDNIEAFGGDARKITIWGQSSGASDVDLYSLAWHEDPIVSGLIMDSCTGLTSTGNTPYYSNFTYVANQVGCGNATNGAEELACMKTIDADKIEAVLEDSWNTYGMVMGNESESMALTFGPSADERTFFSNYARRIQQGLVAKVPAIIGLNKNEGAHMAPIGPDGPDQAVADMMMAMLFMCPTYLTSKARASANLPVHRYLYAGNFSNISPLPWMGAGHGDELPMLFGTHGNYRGASTPHQNAVSEAMQDAWRAFANDPTGGLKSQDWPEYTTSYDVVRVFGEEESVAKNGVDVLKGQEDACADFMVW